MNGNTRVNRKSDACGGQFFIIIGIKTETRLAFKPVLWHEIWNFIINDIDYPCSIA